MILPNSQTTFSDIYNTLLHLIQLTMEMSYMTIWNNCHNNNNINNQLQQMVIQANVKLIISTQTNNDDMINNNCPNHNQICNINRSTYKHLQLNWKCQRQQFQMPNTTNDTIWFSN